MIDDSKITFCCKPPVEMKLKRISGSADTAVLQTFFRNPSARKIELEENSMIWSLPSEYADSRTLLGGACTGIPLYIGSSGSDSKINSEAFVLLRSNAGKYLLAGTLTWRKLLMTWNIRNSKLTLEIHGDSLILDENSQYEADEFVILERDTLYDAMDAYGSLLGEKNRRERKKDLWRGWASWDYFRDEFTHDELIGQAEAVKPLLPEKNGRIRYLLQVDDGYSVWGDWTEVKDRNFPKGFDGLVKDAQIRGFETGIWMAPFLAESTSHIAQAHPDWFLRNSRGKPYRYTICEHTLFLLDYSQDEVCSWWRETLKTVRSWGITYFKFDFLNRGLFSVPGKNPMPPLSRFHRCFDIISEELDKDNCYILGCSAELGPCFGRVDGIRVGPDISPNLKAVRDSSFACIGHFYLQKHVLDCDTDYLVLRGEGERDPERPELFESKFGRLSLNDAQLWSNLSAIDAHIVLAGDNMKFISEDKKSMIRKVMAKVPGDEIFCADPFAGNGSTAAECILSNHNGKTRISLFNWDDKEKTVVLSGSEKGEYTIPPNSSIQINYTGTASFPELARTLHTDRTEQDRKTYSGMIHDFPVPRNAEALPLGEAAKCPLQFERKTQTGMAFGNFASILSKKIFSGIPFDFALSENKVIEQDYGQKGSEIAVSGRIPAFYFLYGVCVPVKNRVCTIRLCYKDGSFTEFPVDCGENIGNWNIRYLFNWHERDAHLSWIDDFSFACMYTARFENPHPEKEAEKIVVSELEQRGTLYIAGLTKAEN